MTQSQRRTLFIVNVLTTILIYCILTVSLTIELHESLIPLFKQVLSHDLLFFGHWYVITCIWVYLLIRIYIIKPLQFFTRVTISILTTLGNNGYVVLKVIFWLWKRGDYEYYYDVNRCYVSLDFIDSSEFHTFLYTLKVIKTFFLYG